MQLVECVPNFSEGRNKDIIDKIASSISAVKGVTLKNVDMGADANRTVFTFVGTPQTIGEAAFRAMARAAELIDMATHSGEHPRIGATDVCPFIPVTGVTMEQCVDIAVSLGKRVGRELGIPVYLYEKAARENKRIDLATVRAGEYEGLRVKMSSSGWKPDFGPTTWNKTVERTGATVVGAREFLIAYNININTRSTKLAWDLALDIRSRGRTKREGIVDGHYWKGQMVKYRKEKYPCGECDFESSDLEGVRSHTLSEHGFDVAELLELHGYDLANLEGCSVKKRGKFDYCKAIGWYMDEFERAQISINLTNFKKTSMHEVYEETKRLAKKLGVTVTGSEIVGLVPYDAIMDSGRFYLERQGFSRGVPADDIIETAVQSLGLRDVVDFSVHDKIIGRPAITSEDMVDMKVWEFGDEVSRDTAAPGGGSIAALSGSMGAALCAMVCNISTGGRGDGAVEPVLFPAAMRAQKLKDALMVQVDLDRNAFDDFVVARSMPVRTPADVAPREAAMQEGLRNAVEVPLRTAKLSLEVLEMAVVAMANGKNITASDALVGAQMAFSGVVGGIANVRINLPGIKDVDYVGEKRKECVGIMAIAEEKMSRVQKLFDDKF